MTVRGTTRDSALTAMLIAEDRELARELHAAVSETRLFDILSELKSYPQEQTLEIRLRQIQPDVVIVDLGTNPAAALAIAKVVCASPSPIHVIGLSRQSDSKLLIDSLRVGVKEFLIAPFDAAAQQAAYAQIKRLREPEGGTPQECGKLVAFTSAKPGSGASTLATQTAFCLKRLTGKRVLLADLDIMSGSLAFALKLNPTYSLLDALENSGQMDPSLWSSLTVNAGGVDVLAAPDLATSDAIEFSRLHDVLEYARVLYDWVIVDLPTVFHRMSLFVLSEAEQALLVSTSELPSLHLARRAVGMLGQLGYGKERFQMVVNRVNRKDDITTADMQKIFTCSVFATFPNDYYALHKVVTRAEPLPAECELGRVVEQVSSRIAGLGAKDKKTGAAIVEQKPVLSEG